MSILRWIISAKSIDVPADQKMIIGNHSQIHSEDKHIYLLPSRAFLTFYTFFSLHAFGSPVTLKWNNSEIHNKKTQTHPL